jgi:molybdopterin synthase catalytic subunit
MIDIRVQAAHFDPGLELAVLHGIAGIGAVASFTGIARPDVNEAGAVIALELEHYPAMTDAALQQLAQAATERWELAACTLIHRVGMIHAGEAIVFVGTASAHRAGALAACEYLIDRLKSDVPFWKKEYRSNGETHWVEAKASDTDRAAGWD